MSVTRREFLVTTASAGVGLTVTGAVNVIAPWAAAEVPKLAPYLSGMRMAATPATAYQAYRSKVTRNPESVTWFQVDLGGTYPLDAIRLFPASERMYPGRDQYYAGEGFPLRFRIETSDDPSFVSLQLIADLTQADFPDPTDNITQYAVRGVHARYVRITATRLRPVKVSPPAGAPPGSQPVDSSDYTLSLAKIAVLSGGRDIAVGCKTSADSELGNPELLAQLTRPTRQDGEEIHRDNRAAVTDSSTWRRPQLKAEIPKTGVTLEGGLFQKALENNIGYLMDSYTTDDLLRQFYERTGKVKGFKPTGSQGFWEEDLAGSNAGRFLMGAANTMRWIDHPELRQRVNAVVDGIDACRQPNGYIMAYPEDSM
jgi:hypothetical protein